MLRSLTTLRRYHIEALDGRLGAVRDIYFDDRDWIVRYFVVDTGGWLTGRQVLISPASVRDVDWDSAVVAVQLTRAQIKQSPDISADEPVSRQMERELIDYYAWPLYWGPSVGSPGATWAGAEAPAMPLAERATQRSTHGDPNLRSVRAVTGYYISARDGDIGHVEDFLADEDDWTIRYMVVDTRNWLAGRTVLVAPRWIREIDWANTRVHVIVDRAAIERSPAWDPARALDRDYEARLFAHYNQAGYWRPVEAGRPR
ncbi:MAG: PRC-barrel domain-containing protein [Planctomycetota bacterium]